MNLDLVWILEIMFVLIHVLELERIARQTFHFETAKVVFANTTRSAKRVKLSTSDIILQKELLQCHYSTH